MPEDARIVTNIIVELLLIRAFCSAVTMRSNIVFAIVNMSGMFFALLLDALGANPLIRTLVIAPAVCIVFPIAYSRGPLKQRALRCAMVDTAMMVTNTIANLALVFIFGTEAPAYSVSSLYVTIVAAITSILAMAFSTELLRAIFRRLDRHDDFTPTPSIIALLLWSYGLSVLSMSLSTPTPYTVNSSLSLVHATYYVFVVLLCAIFFVLFLRDVSAAKQASDHTASVRQSRHARIEIDAAIRRAAITRRLNHELANNANVITQLAEQGNAQKAGVYLDALRKQAQLAVRDIPVDQSATSECS